MKRVTYAALCFFVIISAHAERQIDILDFEGMINDNLGFSGAIHTSFIGEEDLDDFLDTPYGTNAMVLMWNNNGSGWQWWGGNLPLDEPVSLEGMTQLHMWVYFTEDSVGYLNDDGEEEFNFRLEANGGVGLGTNYTTQKGEWVEFVWDIPYPYVDPNGRNPYLNSWNYIAGFICAHSDGGATQGTMIIDNIYATGPDTPNEFEEVVLYGFNSDDPLAFVEGWNEGGSVLFYGEGEVEPTEGSNYLSLTFAGSWSTLATTTDLSRQLLMPVLIGTGFIILPLMLLSRDTRQIGQILRCMLIQVPEMWRIPRMLAIPEMSSRELQMRTKTGRQLHSMSIRRIIVERLPMIQARWKWE